MKSVKYIIITLLTFSLVFIQANCSGGGSGGGNGGGTSSGGSKHFTVYGKVTTASKKGYCSNGYVYCNASTCCSSDHPYYCPTSNLCYSSLASSPCSTGGSTVCGTTLVPTPVSGAHVALMSTKSPGWTLFDLSPSYSSVVTTDSSGNYTFTLPLNLFMAPEPPPFYVAVSDSEMSFTLIAEISIDLIGDNADINLDVNPVTTLAGLWHCPDGDFAAPHYACPQGSTCQYSGGAPCYYDPHDSQDTGSLIPLIESEISKGNITTPDVMNLPESSANLLDDPTILQAVNNILSHLSLWTIDPQVVSSQISASTLPAIPATIGGGGGGCGGTYYWYNMSCTSSDCASLQYNQLYTVSYGPFCSISDCTAWANKQSVITSPCSITKMYTSPPNDAKNGCCGQSGVDF